MLSDFQEMLFMSHFCQGVKVSDKSETNWQLFWENYTIYNSMKTSSSLGVRLQPLPRMGLGESARSLFMIFMGLTRWMRSRKRSSVT